MIELTRPPEPKELAKYRKKPAPSNWEDPAFGSVKAIVRAQLYVAQEACCAYCESLFKENEVHIDHVKPRGSTPARMFDFSNMVLSCNAKEHCGHNKGVARLKVEPGPEANRYFELRQSDGRLVPAHQLCAEEASEASESLRVLNLNASALNWDRKKALKTVDGFRYESGDLRDGELEDFLQSAPFRWTLRKALRRS